MNSNSQLDRRELLGHILSLAGASAVVSFSPEALAKAVAGGKRFLTAADLAVFRTTADILIPQTDTPGAIAAKVPEAFDALLANWAKPEVRTEIVEALRRIAAAAGVASPKGLVGMAPSARLAFITDYDRQALQKPARPAAGANASPFSPVPSVEDVGYYRIKDLVVSLYYVSEIGMTQELVYEHVPGTWVPSLEITTGTRPFASPSQY